MENNIVITGINGQDGSFLAKNISYLGYKIIGIQRPTLNSSQNIYRLKELNIINKIDFEILDLNNIKNTDYLLKKYKPVKIFHLGSQSNVVQSNKLINETEKSNYITTVNFVKSIKKFAKEVKFFYPSSATIYEGYYDTLVDEDTKPKPFSVYAKAKHMAQDYLENEFSNSNLYLRTGIMFSHESEFRGVDFFTRKVSLHLSNYKKGENKTLLLGDISIKRDIGYAKEYVDAIWKISEKSNYQKYIVSRNKLYSLTQFIENCLQVLEINYEIINENNELLVIDKKNNFVLIKSKKRNFRNFDLKNVQGNNNRINSDLNWRPEINLEKIAEKMISYDLNNVYKFNN